VLVNELAYDLGLSTELVNVPALIWFPDHGIPDDPIGDIMQLRKNSRQRVRAGASIELA
jgi:hypothetical protein